LEIIERYFRELLSPKAILLTLLVGSSIALFAPETILETLHFEVLNQKYGFIVGIVWLLSLISISFISLHWLKNWFVHNAEFRKELKKAKDANLTTEMKVVLLFLYHRKPSSESFLERNPAIFRLNQLNFIETPRSMVWISGSEFELFKITQMGSDMVVLRWAEFEGIEGNLNLMEDVLAQIAKEKWTLNR